MREAGKKLLSILSIWIYIREQWENALNSCLSLTGTHISLKRENGAHHIPSRIPCYSMLSLHQCTFQPNFFNGFLKKNRAFTKTDICIDHRHTKLWWGNIMFLKIARAFTKKIMLMSWLWKLIIWYVMQRPFPQKHVDLGMICDRFQHYQNKVKSFETRSM